MGGCEGHVIPRPHLLCLLVFMSDMWVGCSKMQKSIFCFIYAYQIFIHTSCLNKMDPKALGHCSEIFFSFLLLFFFFVQKCPKMKKKKKAYLGRGSKRIINKSITDITKNVGGMSPSLSSVSPPLPCKMPFSDLVSFHPLSSSKSPWTQIGRDGEARGGRKKAI